LLIGEEKRENLKVRERKFKQIFEREMCIAERKWSRRNENEESHKRMLSRLKVKWDEGEANKNIECVFVCWC
jgi:hypothetical protein